MEDEIFLNTAIGDVISLDAKDKILITLFLETGISGVVEFDGSEVKAFYEARKEIDDKTEKE